MRNSIWFEEFPMCSFLSRTVYVINNDSFYVNNPSRTFWQKKKTYYRRQDKLCGCVCDGKYFSRNLCEKNFHKMSYVVSRWFWFYLFCAGCCLASTWVLCSRTVYCTQCQKLDIILNLVGNCVPKSMRKIWIMKILLENILIEIFRVCHFSHFPHTFWYTISHQI